MYVRIFCQDTCHTPRPQWRSSSWLVFQTGRFAMPTLLYSRDTVYITHTVWRGIHYMLTLEHADSFQTFLFHSHVRTYIAHCNHSHYYSQYWNGEASLTVHHRNSCEAPPFQSSRECTMYVQIGLESPKQLYVRTYVCTYNVASTVFVLLGTGSVSYCV